VKKLLSILLILVATNAVALDEYLLEDFAADNHASRFSPTLYKQIVETVKEEVSIFKKEEGYFFFSCNEMDYVSSKKLQRIYCTVAFHRPTGMGMMGLILDREGHLSDDPTLIWLEDKSLAKEIASWKRGVANYRRAEFSDNPKLAKKIRDTLTERAYEHTNDEFGAWYSCNYLNRAYNPKSKWIYCSFQFDSPSHFGFEFVIFDEKGDVKRTGKLVEDDS